MVCGTETQCFVKAVVNGLHYNSLVLCFSKIRIKTTPDKCICGIDIMSWPSKSPNLNPIDHTRDEIMYRRRQQKPNTLVDIRETSQAVISLTVVSMRFRLQGDNRGHTRYWMFVLGLQNCDFGWFFLFLRHFSNISAISWQLWFWYSLFSTIVLLETLHKNLFKSQCESLANVTVF